MLCEHCARPRNGANNPVCHVLGQSPDRPPRRMLWVAGRGPPRGTLDRPPRGKVTQPPPRDDINLRDGPCTVDNNDNVNLIMPSSGDTLNAHSLQTMP